MEVKKEKIRKKFMNKQGQDVRQQGKSGITLIALAITIVVLIILATVSINVLFSENGIISKAEQAKELNRAGSVEEQVAMWKSDQSLAKYTGTSAQTRDEFLADLVSKGLLTPEEKATVEGTGSVTIGGKTIKFGKTLVEMFNAGELKIGDYVNYQNPTSGTYPVSGTKTGMQNYKDDGNTVADDDLNQVYNVANNQLTWRVLGIDEETGGLKLIAGSPMKKETTSNNPYLMMYGAQSYVTGVDELDNICALYKNNLAVTARSVNMDDVDAITGVTTEDKIKEYNLAPYNGEKQYGDPYSFADQYTPESWLNGKTTTTVEGTVDGYYYSVNSQAAEDAPYVTMTDTIAYNLLFNNVEFGSGACYWLASRGVRAGSGSAYFGPGSVGTLGGVARAGTYDMFGSGGREGSLWFGVRPVVVLGSDVTEDEIQKTDQTEIEETWNYGS